MKTIATARNLRAEHILNHVHTIGKETGGTDRNCLHGSFMPVVAMSDTFHDSGDDGLKQEFFHVQLLGMKGIESGNTGENEPVMPDPDGGHLTEEQKLDLGATVRRIALAAGVAGIGVAVPEVADRIDDLKQSAKEKGALTEQEAEEAGQGEEVFVAEGPDGEAAYFTTAPEGELVVDGGVIDEVVDQVVGENIEVVSDESLRPADGQKRPKRNPRWLGNTRPEHRPWETGDVSEIIDGWYAAYAEQPSPLYDQYAETAAAEKTLGRTQVLFTTSDGRLLRGPTDLTDAAGYTPYGMTVSHEGGKAVGTPPAWSQPVREEISQQQSVPASEIEMRHVYKALQNVDPAEVGTLYELIEKRVREITAREGGTIPELIDENFTFFPSSLRDNIPELEYIEARLKDMLPAQIAKESLFNPEAVSSSDARGPLQIMPGTWEKYAREGMDIESLSDSLKVTGQYYSAAYNYFEKNLKTEFAQIKAEFFDGDHMAFVEHFVVPLLINDYNAGDGNIRQAVEWLIENYPTKESLQTAMSSESPLENKDIFFAFSQLAQAGDTQSAYKEYAGDYVPEIAGWDAAFDLMKADKEGVIVASVGGGKEG